MNSIGDSIAYIEMMRVVTFTNNTHPHIFGCGPNVMATLSCYPGNIQHDITGAEQVIKVNLQNLHLLTVLLCMDTDFSKNDASEFIGTVISF